MNLKSDSSFSIREQKQGLGSGLTTQKLNDRFFKRKTIESAPKPEFLLVSKRG